MAVASAGSLSSARALEARRARPARAIGLVIDLAVSSILYAVVNNVFGVPGEGAPGILLVVVWLVYVTVPEAVYGATPGKMLTGVCVVRVDGRPLGVAEIVVRNAGRFLDALPLLYLVGGFSVLISPQSQRIGDWLARTTVVERRFAASPGDTRRPLAGTGRLLAAAMAALLVFTFAFDYFGRPPLVVEGVYRAGQLGVDSYQLGAPQWSFGQVTYPLSGMKSDRPCTGSVNLVWSGFGWDMSGWTENCPVPASS